MVLTQRQGTRPGFTSSTAPFVSVATYCLSVVTWFLLSQGGKYSTLTKTHLLFLVEVKTLAVGSRAQITGTTKSDDRSWDWDEENWSDTPSYILSHHLTGSRWRFPSLNTARTACCSLCSVGLKLQSQSKRQHFTTQVSSAVVKVIIHGGEGQEIHNLFKNNLIPESHREQRARWFC